MKKLMFAALAVLVLLPTGVSAQKYENSRVEVLKKNKGYYKELFMDGGINLTSRRTLPSADSLGIAMEFFASASNKELTATDTLLQQNIFCGYEEDTNGWLLYPDGAPRYRAIYVNGGRAQRHGNSLTEVGRDHIKDFVAAGGSYVGTCAGAFLASHASKKTNKKIRFAGLYLNLWPGVMHSTGLFKANTAMQLEPGSPLTRYYDFGSKGVVYGVRHNGGGYALDSKKYPLPEGTVPLARYIFDDTEKVQIDGKISAWAYKPDAKTGRTVVTGSHPEGVKSGDRLKLMASLLLYAMDGNRAPETKAELKLKEVREMNKYWEDSKPAYTAIGDRQYHHFIVNVPKKCKLLTISLKGYEGKDNFDLTLSANPRKMAFKENAKYVSDDQGCTKTLTIKRPKPGKMYVSVFCNTTVTSSTGKYGTEYSGRTDVLNGVPYSIVVE